MSSFLAMSTERALYPAQSWGNVERPFSAESPKMTVLANPEEFGQTERRYSLKTRQNGSAIEFAWVWQDGELLSPLFDSIEAAELWAAGRNEVKLVL